MHSYEKDESRTPNVWQVGYYHPKYAHFVTLSYWDTEIAARMEVSFLNGGELNDCSPIES